MTKLQGGQIAKHTLYPDTLIWAVDGVYCEPQYPDQTEDGIYPKILYLDNAVWGIWPPDNNPMNRSINPLSVSYMMA